MTILKGFLPISQPGVVNYVGECGSSYSCGLCEGDCDTDSDCEGSLVCYQRSGFEAVTGCSGEGGPRDVFGKDICALPEVQNVGNPCNNYFTDGQCTICTGDCDVDSAGAALLFGLRVIYPSVK